MFGLFKKDPVRNLERQYAEALEKAERELARSGDRALHGRLVTEAEAIGRQLDEARATRDAP
ncbi:MAG: Lacal_2735 family protein [Alphaproteobacteria bacterium]|nr:Lacal_2735 family protein [Alphaproteobacteria bacterium]MCB9692484.1 Lacal_2735 family protein [Alphaproteobacteria bacterium]